MQPWCVNSLAQEAVCFLGANREAVARFITETRAYLAGRRLFRQRLAAAPADPLPEHDLLFSPRPAAHHRHREVCRPLAEQRFLIRNCANFHGLDEGFIRIALKDAATNEAVTRHLLAAVGQDPS
jgi:threonine-phosphate decarboxylase